MHSSGSTELRRFLNHPKVRKVLRTKPLDNGFSLIELVVVIAVLAVLTAIALPNFLGVSDDASARAGQQAAVTAFKECQVRKARGETTGTFSQADITDFRVASTSAALSAITTQPTASKDCFVSGAILNIIAYPNTNFKFPKFYISDAGTKTCHSGDTNKVNTHNVGCDATGAAGAWGASSGSWR